MNSIIKKPRPAEAFASRQTTDPNKLMIIPKNTTANKFKHCHSTSALVTPPLNKESAITGKTAKRHKTNCRPLEISLPSNTSLGRKGVSNSRPSVCWRRSALTASEMAKTPLKENSAEYTWPEDLAPKKMTTQSSTRQNQTLPTTRQCTKRTWKNPLKTAFANSKPQKTLGKQTKRKENSSTKPSKPCATNLSQASRKTKKPNLWKSIADFQNERQTACHRLHSRLAPCRTLLTALFDNLKKLSTSKWTRPKPTPLSETAF